VAGRENLVEQADGVQVAGVNPEDHSRPGRGRRRRNVAVGVAELEEDFARGGRYFLGGRIVVG
jgi:hypothetical protein